MNGLGNNCIQDRCNSPSTKESIGKALHSPCFHCAHCQDILIHIIHLHGLDLVFARNFPFPVDTSPIGRPVTLPRLVL
jgi:hypothetical protein